MISENKMIVMYTTLLWHSMLHTGLCLAIASHQSGGPWGKIQCVDLETSVSQWEIQNLGLILLSLLIPCHGTDHDLSAKAGKIVTH